MSIQLADGLGNQSVDLVLEDLLVRFLVNVPDEDLSSIERVFFQIEEAQWFYTDFVRQLNPLLPSMKMKSFSTKLLKKCPLIWKWGDPADAISRFGKYKSTIPVRGVALFNKDLSKVVLVKGTESNAWSFPRGKISKDESDMDCAVREVEEETGFNARDLISENDMIERTIKGKNYKIYMVKNVPENYSFQPLARNEISKIQWHDVKSIQRKCKSNPNNYFIVSAIMKPMLRWINKNKGVLNEEELMLQAEVKLKSLLGINKPRQENLDAGRELLNILQGVTPRDNHIEHNNQNLPATYDQIIQMNIPQHLHKQFPMLHNQPAQPQPYPIPNQPFFFPQMPPNAFAPMNLSLLQPSPYSHPPSQNQRAPVRPLHASNDYVDQQPNPQSLQKPTTITNRGSAGVNSKEFLSILNKPRTKDEESKSSDDSKYNDHASNRSKAQQLLSLFNKKRPSSNKDPKLGEDGTIKQSTENSPGNTRSESKIKPSNGYDNKIARPHEASNELEESLVGSKEKNNRMLQNEAGKKLTILKRPSGAGSEIMSSNSNNAADILHILGKTSKPKQETEKYSEFQSPSNELLNLLKSNKKEPEKKSVQTSSHELLGIINKKSNNEDLSDLDKMKDKVAPIPIESKNDDGVETFEDFEDFEDFENFEDYEHHHGHNQSEVNSNFEIASDDESINESINDKTLFNDSQGENYSLKPTPDSKKNKIRLLKPGENLNDICGTSDKSSVLKNPEVVSSPSQESSKNKDERHVGKLLLDLLNGGKSQGRVDRNDSDKQSEIKDNNPNSSFMDFGSIYGNSSVNQSVSAPYYSPTTENFSPFEDSSASLPRDPHVISPSILQPHQSINPASASLLSLLGKKPPVQLSYQNSPQTQALLPVNTFTLGELENIQFEQGASTPGAQASAQVLTGHESTNIQSRPADNQSSARTLLDLLKGGKH